MLNKFNEFCIWYALMMDKKVTAFGITIRLWIGMAFCVIANVFALVGAVGAELPTIAFAFFIIDLLIDKAKDNHYFYGE